MGLRTINIRTSSGRSTASTLEDPTRVRTVRLKQANLLPQNEMTLEPPVFYEKQSASGNQGLLNLDDINIEGTFSPGNISRSPGLGDPTFAEASRSPGILGDPQVENNPNPNMQKEKDTLAKAAKDLENTKNARVALQYLKDGSDMVNAYYKYQSVKVDNNANILAANKALMELESDAAYAKLREQTKGQSRASNAMMSAVARGQSASGDIAATSANIEEVYALQQMALIDVNAMRQAIGLENQIIQLGTSTTMARYQRNASMASSLSSMAITGAFA